MKNSFLFALFLYFLPTHFAFAQTYQAGNTYFGAQNYIEYHAGNMPIIITAPHGGRLEPATIPDRTCATCTTVMDGNTMELAMQIDTALRQEFGCFPHIIINRLHRKKLDANREIVEAAQGSADAAQAWQEWHQFIQAAKNDAIRRYGRGILIDMHGHGHTVARLELGYLLDDPDLRLSDSVISTPQYRDRLSIKNLVINNLNNFNAAQLLRGPFSLGTILASNGFPSVPSQQDVAPLSGDAYFNGGYNTLRHGSRDSTKIDAIQIECHNAGVRDSYANRRQFATTLAKALKAYLGKHFFNSTNFNCTTPTTDLSIESIKIFPNPTRHQLNIVFDAPLNQPVFVQFYGANGQLILKRSLVAQTQQTVLDFDTPLSMGLHILTFQDEKGVFLKRVKVLVD